MSIEELAKLSDEELRVECAGQRGWRNILTDEHGIHGDAPEDMVIAPSVREHPCFYLFEIPNYPADLNAMHEVIATLTDEELAKVAYLLRRMSANDPDNPEATLWDAHGWPGLLKASPRQIGIAFIAVKQQPVEVKGGGE